MLHKCEQIFQAAAHRAFAASCERCVFYPQLRLERGDVATDFCRLLAQRYKLAPQQIAQQLQAVIPPEELPGSCVVSDGELSIRLNSLEGFEGGFAAGQATRPRTILLVPPSRSCPIGEYLRLVAVVLVQTALLRLEGAKTRLLLGSKELLSCDQHDGVVNILYWWLNSKPRPEPLSYSELLELVDSCVGEDCCVWMAATAFHRREISRFFHERVEGVSTVRLCHPVRLWLAGTEAELRRHDFSSWSRYELAALLLQLAGPVQGLQLDLCSARLGERSNLLWWISSTVKRIESAAPGLKDSKRGLIYADNVDVNRAGAPARIPQYWAADAKYSLEVWQNLQNLSSGERELLVRLLFFSEFRRRAACQGRVQEFLYVFDHLLDLFSRFFNNPELRSRCGQGRLKLQEWELTAGVWSCLSDMIARCEVFAV